jgi:O-antigen ligase
MLAGFLVVLWLLPFQEITLPISLPFGARLDRALLVGIAAVWLVVLLGGGAMAPRVRFTAVHWAVFAYVALAIFTMLLNLDRITIDAEDKLATGRLALLFAYALFFVIAASSIRSEELQPFMSLILGLAALTAIGTIYEFRADSNVFYTWARDLLPGNVHVGAATGGSISGRRRVIGPTDHGLAVTAMLAMVLPLALVRLSEAKRPSRQFLYGALAILISAGCLATVRKTGPIAVVVAIAFVALFRPPSVPRLLVAAAAGVAVSLLVLPDAIQSVSDQIFGGAISASDSSAGRIGDYPVALVDTSRHLFFGRGYGAFDAAAVRIFDNQYLSLLVTVGVIGTMAFIIVLLCAFGTALRSIGSSDRVRAAAGLAAAASALVFAVVCALFDAMAFPQAPYVFMLMAALGAVAAEGARA